METRDRLTEYIQEAAEELAKRELEDRFCLELSRELLATEFDGDHRKVRGFDAQPVRIRSGILCAG